nr:hypothetical protein [Victivallis vadensis]
MNSSTRRSTAVTRSAELRLVWISASDSVRRPSAASFPAAEASSLMKSIMVSAGRRS